MNIKNSINTCLIKIKKVLTNLKILLFSEGQLKSILLGKPINNSSEPVPWYTYPAIDFIDSIDFSNAVAFEFGSGSSTQYWMSRVHKLYTVEHDSEWYKKTLSSFQTNVDSFLEENHSKYASVINTTGENEYDLVIVDGIERYKSAVEAVSCIKKTGIIILDNSDWHQKTAKYIRSKGFTQIDFYGFGPINDYKWATSIFLQASTTLKYKGATEVAGIIKQEMQY